MADVNYSASSLSGGLYDTTWPKAQGIQTQALPINHTMRTDWLACPRAPSKQRLLSGRLFQGLTGHLLAASQGPDLSLACAGFEQPRHTEQCFTA